MAAQVAKEIFRVPRVFAKVNDPIRAHTYRALGIITWSRTTILGTLLHSLLTGREDVGPRLIAEASAHDAALANEGER